MLILILFPFVFESLLVFGGLSLFHQLQFLMFFGAQLQLCLVPLFANSESAQARCVHLLAVCFGRQGCQICSLWI